MSLIYSELVFVYDVVCVYICAQLCLTLCSPQPSSLLCLWNFPGKNTGAGYCVLFHGIFLTQGLNPCLLPMSPALQEPLRENVFTTEPLGENVSLQCNIGIQIYYFSHMDNCLFQNIYWNIYPYVLLVICSYTFPCIKFSQRQGFTSESSLPLDTLPLLLPIPVLITTSL